MAIGGVPSKPPQQEMQVVKNNNTFNNNGMHHMNVGSEDKVVREKSAASPIISKNNTTENFTPIKALTTFTRDWVIKARVVQKSELRNTRNGGKLLKIELVDSMNTHIEATFFNDTA